MPMSVRTRLKTICAALLHTTILQVVLGAIYRHLKETSEKGAGHTLYMHMFVSLVVVVFAIIAGVMPVASIKGMQRMADLAAGSRGGVLLLLGRRLGR